MDSNSRADEDPAAELESRPCAHRGNPVRVGQYTIFAGGTNYLGLEDLLEFDVVISLTYVSVKTRKLLVRRGVKLKYHPLKDFGGVSDNWQEFVQEIIRDLEEGKRVLVFCIGSHGRTGTFLASLVALLEPGCEDPIAAVRERHCQHAPHQNP